MPVYLAKPATNGEKRPSRGGRPFGRATDASRTRDLSITNRMLYQLSYGGDAGKM